jgi:hypothetical protein
MLRYNTLVLLFGFLLTSVAQADVIVVESLSGSPGAYSYQYEIENQTAVTIFDFSLTVTGEVGDIQSPVGWASGTDVPAPGETLVEWVDLDESYDVPAFGTLSGFAIASDSSPGNADFSTLDENFMELDGQTTGPIASTSTAPEPGSMVLLAAALIWLYIRRRSYIF